MYHVMTGTSGRVPGGPMIDNGCQRLCRVEWNVKNSNGLAGVPALNGGTTVVEIGKKADSA